MGSSEKHYQPFDRLTMIADDVSAFIKDHPLYEDGDKGMLCLNDTAKGGICLFGYEGDEREGVFVFARLEVGR